MSVGDVNSNAKGSGARYNEGKPDYSMIPLCTMEDEIRVWMYGAKKYAKNNWMKGMDWDVPFACMMRHMAAWQRGEENDPETGLPHLAHAMCNLRMLTLYSKTYREGDHRPAEWLQEYMPVRPVQEPVPGPIEVKSAAASVTPSWAMYKPPINGVTGQPLSSIDYESDIALRQAGLLPKEQNATNKTK